MLINSQGFGHYLQQINNQDFAFETSRMLLVLDGCSGAKYSEVGTRLFTQLFSRKEENDSVENFEKNVKEVFDEIIEMFRKFYPTQEELENDFIMENLLFTIIACFECENEFIVKMFGDGYIITQNIKDNLSFMKFSYGKCPPYFGYKYCYSLTPNVFKDYEFKTFKFDKKDFKNVGIASDGIFPIVRKKATGFDTDIIKTNNIGLKMSMKMQGRQFADDVTIALFEREEQGFVNSKVGILGELRVDTSLENILFEKKPSVIPDVPKSEKVVTEVNIEVSEAGGENEEKKEKNI